MIELHKLGLPSVFSQEQPIEISVPGQSKEFILNSLVPKYWKILQKPGIKLHTDPDRKQILVPEHYFNLPGNAFSLLHEIGHANLDDSKSEESLEEEMALRDQLTYKGPNSFTEEQKINFRTIVYVDEENAWNFALSTNKRLKESGINLEPEMTEEALRNLASQKLLSYNI